MNDKMILVVDDEERMRGLLRDFLVRDGYRVLEAADGEEALALFCGQKGISLVLLDVMMPNMDGWECLKALRGLSRVPVIMLTARSEEQDEIRGFKLGVTEYVTKPFSPKVLMARVNALLGGGTAQVLENAGLKIDKTARAFYVDGEPVELSLKEYDLMLYFMENPGQALSRDTILDHVWNYNFYGDARTIDTHVKKLRAKLGAKGAYIRTVRGYGYKFEVQGEES